MGTIPRLAAQDLAMYRGDGATWRAAVTDADNLPWDLTGWAATFIATRPDGTTLCSLSIGAGITVASAAGGLLDVVVPPLSTSGLLAQEVCGYKLRITRGAQGPFTVAAGTLTVLP